MNNLLFYFLFRAKTFIYNLLFSNILLGFMNPISPGCSPSLVHVPGSHTPASVPSLPQNGCIWRLDSLALQGKEQEMAIRRTQVWYTRPSPQPPCNSLCHFSPRTAHSHTLVPPSQSTTRSLV